MKAVIFDFDGTLTQKQGNLWKKIWINLGYDVSAESYYVSLFKKFMNKEISHHEWCDLTCEAYQAKGFSEQLLNEMIENINLMFGVGELIKKLYLQGIEIHIVSGNIVDVIEKVLGENINYIEKINANDFLFDEHGNLVNIVGTKYDFEGKARYINELCENKQFKPSEIVFVGNSINDEWVHSSGAKTICINPHNTKCDDRAIWNKVIRTDNLMDLYDEIVNV